MRTRSISLKSLVSPSPPRAAFTLIELLVAMGILMIIVLMMANLFQQSTRAYESGTRQTGAGLEARAVLGMIQRDLSQAVADTNRTFSAGPSSLDFYTLGVPSATNSEIQHVTYSGGDPGPLTRNGVTLLDAASFLVDAEYVDPATASPGRLPDFVDINIEISRDSKYSTVRAYALGRRNDGSSRDYVDTGRGD